MSASDKSLSFNNGAENGAEASCDEDCFLEFLDPAGCALATNANILHACSFTFDMPTPPHLISW